MRMRKVYIPIGLCLLVILVIGLLSLRSDVPDEPVRIYKTSTPAEAQVQSTPNGHVHADGTFHAEPHIESTHPQIKIAETDGNTATYAQLLAEKEALEAAVAKGKADLQRNRDRYEHLLGRYTVLKEESVIHEEVKVFDAWVSTINFQEEFGELLVLPSLSPEEIRSLYMPDELETLVKENVQKFNAYREEFITRLENCSPKAREIIHSQINADPELSKIYATYIEKPLAIPGGVE